MTLSSLIVAAVLALQVPAPANPQRGGVPGGVPGGVLGGIPGFGVPQRGGAPLGQVGPAAAPSTIEGAVLRAGSDLPIPDAQVTLIRISGLPGAPPQPASPVPPLKTDVQGRFVAPGLAPGTYRIIAARNGFASQEYGQRSIRGSGTPLEVPAGQEMKGITLRLTPAGTIAGRVTGDNGEPLARISVQLMRAAYDADGNRTIQPVANAQAAMSLQGAGVQTDDRGEYRMFWIPPGRYYVSATVPASASDMMGMVTGMFGNSEAMQAVVINAMAETAAAGQTQEPAGPAYYPDAIDPSMAVQINVKPGEELGGLNIRLSKQQMFRIRGRVVDTKTGQPPATATVMLGPQSTGPSGGVAPKTATNYNPATGAFELRDVAPGSYSLVVIPSLGDMMQSMFGALSAIGQGAPGAPGTPPGNPGAPPSANPPADFPAGLPTATMAQTAVKVVNADIDNLVVRVGPGISISGQAGVEGQPSFSALPNSNRVRVSLQSRIPGGTGAPASVVKSDGGFSLDGVAPGEYRVTVSGLPSNAYVKAARSGSDDLLQGTLSVADTTPARLEITISAKGGRIAATVVDRDRKAVNGVQAVLIPDRQRERHDLYKTARSGPDGKLTIEGVPPGDYKLFAWDDLEPNSYFDPEVLRSYELKGAPVRVSEAAELTIEATLIPALEQ